MDVRPQTSPAIAKSFILLFALLMIAIFSVNAGLTSSVAHSQGERVFENTIPKDVPIKVKIKKEKEKSFKDLKNEKWVREFELEVTNSGNKPIYFLFVDLISDVKIGGDRLVFSLTYGRVELGDIISKALPDDVPIKPGETYAFKIHSGQVLAWEHSVRNGNHPEASRIQAKIEALSFGDGTGYFGNQPYPPSERRQSALGRRVQRSNKSRPRARAWPSGKRGTQVITSSIIDMPATFLPANFLSSVSSKTLSFKANALPGDGCLFGECVGIVPWTGHVCYNCPPQNRPNLIQPAFAGN